MFGNTNSARAIVRNAMRNLLQNTTICYRFSVGGSPADRKCVNPLSAQLRTAMETQQTRKHDSRGKLANVRRAKVASEIVGPLATRHAGVRAGVRQDAVTAVIIGIVIGVV